MSNSNLIVHIFVFLGQPADVILVSFKVQAACFPVKNGMYILILPAELPY